MHIFSSSIQTAMFLMIFILPTKIVKLLLEDTTEKNMRYHINLMVRKVRKTMILTSQVIIKQDFPIMFQTTQLDFWCGICKEVVRKIHTRQGEKESKLPDVPAKYQSGSLEQALRSTQLSSAWSGSGLSYVKLCRFGNFLPDIWALLPATPWFWLQLPKGSNL